MSIKNSFTSERSSIKHVNALSRDCEKKSDFKWSLFYKVYDFVGIIQHYHQFSSHFSRYLRLSMKNAVAAFTILYLIFNLWPIISFSLSAHKSDNFLPKYFIWWEEFIQKLKYFIPLCAEFWWSAKEESSWKLSKQWCYLTKEYCKLTAFHHEFFINTWQHQLYKV